MSIWLLLLHTEWYARLGLGFAVVNEVGNWGRGGSREWRVESGVWSVEYGMEYEVQRVLKGVQGSE